jgi:hypothetical protein
MLDKHHITFDKIDCPDMFRATYMATIALSIFGGVITIWSIAISDLSLLFTYVFFALLLRLIPADVHKWRLTLHYVIYSAFGLLYYLYYNVINGKPFIGGGDDELFWVFANELAHSNFDFSIQFSSDLFFWAIEFKAYIIIFAGYIKFLSLLGFDGQHMYNLVLMSTFIAALSAGLMFRIIKGWYPHLKSKYLFIISCFPILIFHNVTLLRESWLVMLFLLLVLVIQGKGFFYKMLFIPAILITAFFFRPAHGGLFLIFIISYLFFSLKSKKQRTIILFISFIAFLGFVKLGGLEYAEIISETSEYYMELTEENSSANSLGNIFYSSDNPVFLAMRPIVLLFSPIPPPILARLRMDTLFFSLGSILWYYLNGLNILAVLFFSKHWRKTSFPHVHIAMAITILASLILISLTSRDPRHLVYIHPFLLVYGINNYLTNRKLRRLFPLLAFIAMFGIISLYSLLKAIA